MNRFVHDFYGQLYRSRNAKAMPHWIHSTWMSASPRITPITARKATAELKHMKSCCRYDMLVAEMLQSALEDVFDMLAAMTNYR